MELKTHIGLVGTGYMAKGFYLHCSARKDAKVTAVLTRRQDREIVPFKSSIVTRDAQKLVDNCDVIFECSGDVIHATQMAELAIAAKKPMVTLNAEFHATVGAYYANRGLICEAEGDQPSVLYKLALEAKEMGFSPILYGIYKRYLELQPTHKQATYWSLKNGNSFDKTVAFTDGSKVEIESLFLANSLGLNILKSTGTPYVDSILPAKPSVGWFLHPEYPTGVFVVGKQPESQAQYMKYLGMGDGPYMLVRPYHLCHLEVMKTIKEVIKTNKPFMQSRTQRYMPIAIAKKSISAGKTIDRALGSMEFRSEHAITSKELVPITLLQQAKLKVDIQEGDVIKMSDVELPRSKALEIWHTME